jgi:hypothetical protein
MWRRTVWILPLVMSALVAEEVPVGVVSGYISDIQAKSFLLKTTTGKEFRCSYDNRTWFEQSRVRVPVRSFPAGRPG